MRFVDQCCHGFGRTDADTRNRPENLNTHAVFGKPGESLLHACDLAGQVFDFFDQYFVFQNVHRVVEFELLQPGESFPEPLPRTGLSRR